MSIIRRLFQKIKIINRQNYQSFPKDNKKSILFLRDYHGYTGGHQKVFDYFKHSIELGLDAKIYFTKESLWDKNNPWAGYAKYIDNNLNFDKYDLLFFEGMDWARVKEGIEEKKRVINLIQGFRHTNPKYPQYQFLSKKAIRIAVSNEVAKALKATDRVNGEIYTIENGIELKEIDIKKDIDIFILGAKNPYLAKELEEEIKNIDSSLKTLTIKEHTDRDKVLEYMARAKISIVLPNPEVLEGFFIPALEAMNYSDIAIAPDCIGNRGFCKDKINCLMPKYEKEEILKSLLEALDILKDSKRLESMRLKAKESVKDYSLKREREEFFKLLNKIINKRDKNV